MVVLGDERDTALDAYVAAWKFISGDVWWQIFFTSILGSIPVAIARVVLIRTALPHSDLYGRYREAYQNSAQ
jgi:hypothetical protein